MKLYAVIDTNVIVSALLSRKPDTATVRVLRAIESGQICPLFHSDIITEYKEVLTRPKFRLPFQSIITIVKTIESLGISANRVESHEYFPDSKDVVFYEVALSKEDAYLVTGNMKHFPQKPIVVTPAEMMQILDDLTKKKTSDGKERR